MKSKKILGGWKALRHSNCKLWIRYTEIETTANICAIISNSCFFTRGRIIVASTMIENHRGFKGRVWMLSKRVFRNIANWFRIFASPTTSKRFPREIDLAVRLKNSAEITRKYSGILCESDDSKELRRREASFDVTFKLDWICASICFSYCNKATLRESLTDSCWSSCSRTSARSRL